MIPVNLEIVQFLASRQKPQDRLIASEMLNMQPSIQVRNLLETAVLQIQHSPDLSEEEVRWIQQFAARLITEFSVLKEPDLLYAPVEEWGQDAVDAPQL